MRSLLAALVLALAAGQTSGPRALLWEPWGRGIVRRQGELLGLELLLELWLLLVLVLLKLVLKLGMREALLLKLLLRVEERVVDGRLHLLCEERRRWRLGRRRSTVHYRARARFQLRPSCLDVECRLMTRTSVRMTVREPSLRPSDAWAVVGRGQDARTRLGGRMRLQGLTARGSRNPRV